MGTFWGDVIVTSKIDTKKEWILSFPNVLSFLMFHEHNRLIRFFFKIQIC